MRGQALLAVPALVAALMTAQPAAAGDYNSYNDAYVAQSRACSDQQVNNTAGGAILGGILGAVIGSHVAANHHRGDGAVLGAAAGALAGGAIGNANTQCNKPAQGAYDPYYGQPQNGPGPYQDSYYDRRAGDDGRLLGGPDGRAAYSDYRRDDCRWDTMTVRSRDGYPIRQNVWECRGRDGVWRPAPRD
jgi:hypothetical protein